MKNICAILLFLLTAVGFSGCQVVETIDSLNGILEPPPPDSELGQLLQAEKAFFEGNYAHARELYQTVMSDTFKPVYINHALYGLACVDIITATTPDAFKAGVVSLLQWQEPQTNAYGENPRMLAEALNAREEMLRCEPEIRYVTTKKKGELLEKHKNEIKELKETIKRLEHQISVLEAIDQEIQEKRKPL